MSAAQVIPLEPHAPVSPDALEEAALISGLLHQHIELVARATSTRAGRLPSIDLTPHSVAVARRALARLP